MGRYQNELIIIHQLSEPEQSQVSKVQKIQLILHHHNQSSYLGSQPKVDSSSLSYSCSRHQQNQCTQLHKHHSVLCSSLDGQHGANQVSKRTCSSKYAHIDK